MTVSINPLFPHEIVHCMAEGRDPTVHELFSVAERIWSDGQQDRSVFAWGDLAATSVEKRNALRAARVALCGGSDIGLLR